MRFGQRSGPARASRRKNKAVLRAEGLEGRLLMAIDLVNTANAPFGIQEVGSNPGLGVGWSVAEVGDTNGDGFDDFLVGAPTVVPTSTGGYRLGNGSGSRAMLIFGSRGVQSGNIDWATIAGQLRTGDLSFLGNNPPQNNPINGQPSFPFDGIVFNNSISTNSLLGASVAAVGDVNADGLQDFMIGAPGANSSTGVNNGAGRAYLIYGSNTLSSSASKTIDLDSQATFFTNIITFTNSISGARTGASLAGIGDFITDTLPDIAVGAPGASYNSLSNSGAAYVISGTVIRSARTTTFDISGAGQANGFQGITFTGSNINETAGTSVGGDFNFDGDTTSANQQITDLVIGGPGSGAGRAYLVYGAINIASQAITVNGVNQIRLNRIGDPATTGNVAGFTATGAASGDQTGFVTTSAGDFNGDGLGDFIVGSPNAAAGNGAATILEGRSFNNRILGDLPLGNIPATVNFVTLTGPSTGSLTGFSASLVGRLNNDTFNEIVIGAPGFNNSAGAVYLIPGNPDLYGTFSLQNAEAQPIAATLITVSGSVGPAFLGSSVSGRLTRAGQTRTLDADLIGDVIVGSAGYSFPNAGGTTTSRLNGGTVFGLEGIFLPLQVPVSTAITTTIGIGQARGPFIINATTPAALDIYVYSNASSSPVFRPVTDIDPTTVVVGGVAYPNATVAADPTDQNGDGITDAIVTITPRANLNLSNGAQTLTVSGRTTTAAGNNRWTGSASVTVTGAGGGGGGGGSTNSAGSSLPPGFIAPTSFVGPDGAALVPTLASLSTYESYKPIPVSVAIDQYLPNPFFNRRNRAVAHHRSVSDTQGLTSNRPFASRGVHTLGTRVFTRGKFHAGKKIAFRHPVPVVPIQRRREVY
ncbi:MAG: integrin alpha [Isosphaeraceae bacterium]|nr:integrin alpha [Isosphaeraceae bacterium]